jgi:hypothetical protein
MARCGTWTAFARASMAARDVVLAVGVLRCAYCCYMIVDYHAQCDVRCRQGAVGPNGRRRVAPSPSWLTPRMRRERFPNLPVTQSSLTARPLLRRGQYGLQLLAALSRFFRCRSIHFSHPPPNRIRKLAFVPGRGRRPAAGAVQLMMPGGSKAGT